MTRARPESTIMPTDKSRANHLYKSTSPSKLINETGLCKLHTFRLLTLFTAYRGMDGEYSSQSDCVFCDTTVVTLYK